MLTRLIDRILSYVLRRRCPSCGERMLYLLDECDGCVVAREKA